MTDTATPAPREAFEMLLAGNDRFAAGTPEHPDQDAARRAEIVVRTAGHVMGPAVLGSIEYGVSVLGCPLVVFLGHDACDAVAATRAPVDGGTTADGFVRDVVERVTPSVLAARAAGASTDADFITEHVRATDDLLTDRSRVLADRVAAGRTAVVGLSYRLADGRAQLVATRGLDLPTERQATIA
ncbi:carbonic anhydrase [Streptomyces sp. NPDC048304]|uniref:carbonic anhydrase n=1 Tax=Streptomyces sp. NPDC048304 TaxID=3154820 RepID=UPI0033D37F92